MKVTAEIAFKDDTDRWEEPFDVVHLSTAEKEVKAFLDHYNKNLPSEDSKPRKLVKIIGERPEHPRKKALYFSYCPKCKASFLDHIKEDLDGVWWCQACVGEIMALQDSADEVERQTADKIIEAAKEEHKKLMERFEGK